jgi:hypothetical protein
MLRLEVKNLNVEIDGKKILNGLDLTIEKGRSMPFAPYNTKDEVDTLAESMVKAREFFA